MTRLRLIFERQTNSREAVKINTATKREIKLEYYYQYFQTVSDKKYKHKDKAST